MSALSEAVEMEARAKARRWVAQERSDVDRPYTAPDLEESFTAGYLKGREDALAEVAACLRFMPEGSLP